LKIIVSHDVDHLFWSDHFFKDLFIPKLWYRSLRLAFTGALSFSDAFSRMNFWKENRMNRISELMAFEESRNISATYFFVMRPGLGVAYPFKSSIKFIEDVLAKGHNVGVHGMEYRNEAAMMEEFNRFQSIAHQDKVGVRMHYLRNDETTFKKLAGVGYSFDSTQYGIQEPYKISGMVEFPISVMDVYCVQLRHRSVDAAKEHTLDQLSRAEKNEQPYFVINFHDIYYQPAYKLYKEWFEWLIDLCIQRGYEFTSFNKEVGLWI